MSRGRNAAMRWRGRLGVFALVLAAFALPNRIAAQEMEVPTSVQIPLFLKVITFDRQLHSRGHGDFVIAVAYQSGNRTSTTVRDEVVRAFEAAHETVAGAPVRVVTIDLDKESAADALKERLASVMYVTPLRGVDVGTLSGAAAAAGVTTISGVPRYVGLGIAVGVRLKGDRPRILINLQCARTQGADFAAELLKLAEVMQ